jgi:hypothetical protein
MVLIAKRIRNSFSHLDLTFTSLPTYCRNGSLKSFTGLGRQCAAHKVNLNYFVGSRIQDTINKECCAS